MLVVKTLFSGSKFVVFYTAQLDRNYGINDLGQTSLFSAGTRNEYLLQSRDQSLLLK